jgi:anaerobic dimethyl sulfoxide reductase subunit A
VSAARAGAVELPVSCNLDCGAGCALLAEVRQGRLARIRDNPLRPPLARGCARGYAMARRVYAPDRITRPLLADGPRGSGRFRQAGWEEALDRVARGLAGIGEKHGPESVILLGGSGSCRGALHNTEALGPRFLSLFGGFTATSGSFSSAAERFVAPYVFGTPYTGLDPATLEHSRLILLWGANVADLRFGASLESWLRRCRRRGVPVVAVDPRRSRTAARLADEWVPVRPGTDAALMAAVLHVLLEEDLVDRAYLERYTTGFPQVEAYVRGRGPWAGAPRSPAWAEGVCGTPAAGIARLARRYAAARPAALIPGLSIQRNVGGEEAMRMSAVLQAATGNAGLPGGSTGGNIWGRLPGPRCGRLPGRAGRAGAAVPPPRARSAAAGVQPSVPVYRWADAVLEGKAGGYPRDLRAAYNLGGNYLCQGSDVHKSQRALGSLELVVSHEQFLTPTARWSDVVLPATTFLEREDIVFPEGNFLFYSHRAIAPVGQARNDYDILRDLAERLGFQAEFSEGRDEAAWLQSFLAEAEVPDPEGFRRTGVYAGPEQERTALSAFIVDPRAHPLGTPSGRIELASEAYARTGFPAVPEFRGPAPDPEHPLALITPHARYRVNSQFSNDPLLRDREPQALAINPADADPRGVGDAALVTVYSPQGQVRIAARVTEDIMPGVVCLAAGVWPELDERGTDTAGSANLLTSTQPTLPSQGARTHSVWVQVRLA